MNGGKPSCRRKRAREAISTASAAPTDNQSNFITKKARHTKVAKPAASNATTNMPLSKAQGEPKRATRSQLSKAQGEPQRITRFLLSKAQGEPERVTRSQLSKAQGEPQRVTTRSQLCKAAKASIDTKTMGVTDPQPMPNKAKGTASQSASGTCFHQSAAY